MARGVDHAARENAVIAALARTANVQLAVDEAGITHSWAYRRRKADADFAGRWDAAMRHGRAALAQAARHRERDEGAQALPDGLLLSGSSGKGTIRLERQKRWSFTPAKRARFLDALRATCNVKLAARAAGISATGGYRSYHKDAAFRAAWDSALVEGRVHLEMALIGAARELVEPSDEFAGEPVEPPTITGMDAKVAIQLLRLHNPRDAAGRPRGIRVKPADAESVRREILAKVAAVKAARAWAGTPHPNPSGRTQGTSGGRDHRPDPNGEGL